MMGDYYGDSNYSGSMNWKENTNTQNMEEKINKVSPCAAHASEPEAIIPRTENLREEVWRESVDQIHDITSWRQRGSMEGGMAAALREEFTAPKFPLERPPFIESIDNRGSRALDEYQKDVDTIVLETVGLKSTDNNTKDTNPKDSVGTKKVPMSVVSGPVLMEVGLGMLEGALKYGRHNYRDAGVRASVYYDATMRHLMAWYEGEDIDPASKMSHITKAITSLVVLRDSMIRENWVDDRPPRTPDGWIEKYNAVAEELINKYPNPVPALTEKKA